MAKPGVGDIVLWLGKRVRLVSAPWIDPDTGHLAALVDMELGDGTGFNTVRLRVRYDELTSVADPVITPNGES